MASEFVAGVSYTGDIIQTVVLKLKRSGPVLLHLSEEKTDARDGIWFLRDIVRPELRVLKKITALSIGIDNRSVFYHSFPVEQSLSPQSRDEQVDWELSQYIGGYAPEDFVRDIHLLPSAAGGEVASLLVVAANRKFVGDIQSLVRERDLRLRVIETNFFGAAHAHSVNYPEMTNRKVLVVTVEHDRVDAGVMYGGKPVRYRCAAVDDQDDVMEIMEECVRESGVDEIFVAGPAATHGIVNTAGTRLGVQATMLNPVSQLRCARRYLRSNEFAGVEHRFASVIGCALRER